MTCDPWQEKLDAYVDGDASQEELAGLGAHLRTCPVLRRGRARPLADEAHDASSCGGALFSVAAVPSAHGKEHPEEVRSTNRCGHLPGCQRWPRSRLRWC